MAGESLNQTTFTWEGWFKTSASGSEMAILSREPTNSSSWPYRILITTAGYLQFDIKVNSALTYILTSQATVNDGNWHNFAASFDSVDNVMQLWVDGIKHAERTECTTNPPTSTTDLSIGRSNGASYFEGYIDELRFSDTARSYTVANKRYIYYNNSRTLTVTETYSESVGNQKVLLAIMTPKLNYGSCELQVLGNDGTVIDGDKIQTGRISSADGKTYFDLNDNRLMMNDGVNRLILGEHATRFN